MSREKDEGLFVSFFDAKFMTHFVEEILSVFCRTGTRPAFLLVTPFALPWACILPPTSGKTAVYSNPYKFSLDFWLENAYFAPNQPTKRPSTEDRDEFRGLGEPD
jgi:hypothetical protein